ncbi:MAG: hypothetical protein IJF40_05930 [Clostridia bacterium]|nr:hypothetical protein [Clostridia bacterium]MBQ7046722.1 hypothetical protein [Oscillospiraceae bacterium]
MLNITKKFAKELKSINPISKFIIKSAGFLVIILYTLAVCAFICAGRGFDYYAAYALGADLLGCIKPSLGVLLLGALLFEAIWVPKAEKDK